MIQSYPKISLKAARVNAGLTQKKAAELIGVSQATLQNYECGNTVPNWETVDAIEKIYRFPANYIFFGKILAKREDKADN